MVWHPGGLTPAGGGQLKSMTSAADNSNGIQQVVYTTISQESTSCGGDPAPARSRET